jgi:uncharacterized protein (TIGR02466 family)
MENIINFLPIPVYHKPNAFTLSDNLVNRLVSADLEVMREIKDILNEDAQEIYDTVNMHLKYYAEEIMGIDDSVWFDVIQTMLIKIRPEESMNIHDHPNCMLSAVYYLDDAPESSPLVFFNEPNVFKNFNFLLPYKKETPYNQSVHKIHPKKGDLIIFPAWLHHFVPKNETTETRYSLASLAWIRGEISPGTPNAWDRNFNSNRKEGSVYSPNLKFK